MIIQQFAGPGLPKFAPIHMRKAALAVVAAIWFVGYNLTNVTSRRM
jgi:hypothetical protein